jgi:hypothetical protein
VPGDNGLMRFFSQGAQPRRHGGHVRERVEHRAADHRLLDRRGEGAPGYLASAGADWVIAPGDGRFVAEASPYMANRMDNEVRRCPTPSTTSC